MLFNVISTRNVTLLTLKFEIFLITTPRLAGTLLKAHVRLWGGIHLNETGANITAHLKWI